MIYIPAKFYFESRLEIHSRVEKMISNIYIMAKIVSWIDSNDENDYS